MKRYKAKRRYENQDEYNLKREAKKLAEKKAEYYSEKENQNKEVKHDKSK